MHSHAERHLHGNRPVLHDRMAPPAVDASSATFVATFVLVSLGLVAGLVAIAMAPLTVTIPLAIVLATYLVGTSVIVWEDRRRARAAVAGGGSVPRVNPALRTLAASSTTFLIAAFLVPEGLGSVLAAIGLGGLLVFRIMAMPAGWGMRRPPGPGPRP
jgi:hypothetical protein